MSNNKKLALLLVMSCGFCLYSLAQKYVPFLKANGKYILVDSASLKPVLMTEYSSIRFDDNLDFFYAKTQNKTVLIDMKSLATVVPAKYEYISYFSDNAARVELNEKTGYILKNGKPISPVKYNSYDDFFHGYCFVQTGNKGAFIDKTGKEYFTGLFDSRVSIYANGIAIATRNDKKGCVNLKTGKIILPPNYSYLEVWPEYNLIIAYDNLYHFYNLAGKEFYKAALNEQPTVRNGIIKTKLNNLYGFIRSNGIVVAPNMFKSAGDFNEEGFAIIRDPNGTEIFYTVLDKNGKQSEIFDWIDIFREGYFGKMYGFVAKQNGKYGLLDKKFKPLTEYKYESPSLYPRYKQNNKWGLIDTAGKEITAPVYDTIIRSRNEHFVVKQGNTYKIIDLQGKEMATLPAFDNLSYVYEGGFIEFIIKGKYGIMNESGKIIIPAKYDKIRATNQSSSLLIVKQNNLWGVVNTEGKELTEIIYTKITDRDSWLLLSKNDLDGAMDYSGNLLLKPTKTDGISTAGKFLVVTKDDKDIYISRQGKMYQE